MTMPVRKGSEVQGQDRISAELKFVIALRSCRRGTDPESRTRLMEAAERFFRCFSSHCDKWVHPIVAHKELEAAWDMSREAYEEGLEGAELADRVFGLYRVIVKYRLYID